MTERPCNLPTALPDRTLKGMRHIVLAGLLVACGGGRSGQEDADLFAPMTAADCAGEDTRAVLGCSWTPPLDADEFVRCEELAESCAHINWTCAEDMDRASATLYEDCHRLQNESAVRRAYVRCGNTLGHDDWPVDADVVAAYVADCFTQ